MGTWNQVAGKHHGAGGHVDFREQLARRVAIDGVEMPAFTEQVAAAVRNQYQATAAFQAVQQR
ncbi:hypothetical protein D3C80_1162510 [compost metagenome]